MMLDCLQHLGFGIIFIHLYDIDWYCIPNGEYQIE